MVEATGLGALRAAPTNSHTGLFGLLYNFSITFAPVSKQKHSRTFSPPSSPVAYHLQSKKRRRLFSQPSSFFWSRRRDLNPRPLGPEPSALPNCATPRSTAPMKALHRNSLDIIYLFLKKNNRFYALFLFLIKSINKTDKISENGKRHE